MVVESSYPNYQPVLSRWIPRVPEHWSLLRAKNFLREIDDRSKTGEETLLSMRMQRGLVPHHDVSVKRIAPENLIGYKKARPDELVLNRMQAGNAMFFRNRHPGLVSPDYAVFRLLRDDNPEYLGHLFRSWPMRGLFRSESKGLGTGTSGFLRLYSDRFAALEIPLPPRPEQDQIVAYLHAQDAHIARFIKTKRDLIRLLAEQKLRIIDHAVTRGLDAAVALKPSGIEWMGEVPEHWQVARLRQLSISLQTGPFGSQLHSSDYVDDGIPVINPSHLKDGAIVPDVRCAVDVDTATRLSRHSLAANDVIFARRGELGRCALVTAKEVGWLCGTGSLKVRLRPNAINSEFLMFVLSSPLLRGDLRLYSVGSTMENANTSIIGNIRIPLPPADEQQAICRWISDECQPLDDAIARTKEEIKLIREYRDRLIADVVTGQVDVRGWQPGPDDVVDDAALAVLNDDPDDAAEEEGSDGEES
jgi:type I restriction enzyme S subunit